MSLLHAKFAVLSGVSQAWISQAYSLSTPLQGSARSPGRGLCHLRDAQEAEAAAGKCHGTRPVRALTLASMTFAL